MLQLLHYRGVRTMKKYFILSLFVLLLSFTGKVYAHCGDAEAHAAASQEHIDKDNAIDDDTKKENKAYKNNMTNRY